MMAGVKATYWAVIGADKRADNSPNWTVVLMLRGFIDWRGWRKAVYTSWSRYLFT